MYDSMRGLQFVPHHWVPTLTTKFIVHVWAVHSMAWMVRILLSDWTVSTRRINCRSNQQRQIAYVRFPPLPQTLSEQHWIHFDLHLATSRAGITCLRRPGQLQPINYSSGPFKIWTHFCRLVGSATEETQKYQSCFWVQRRRVLKGKSLRFVWWGAMCATNHEHFAESLRWFPPIHSGASRPSFLSDDVNSIGRTLYNPTTTPLFPIKWLLVHSSGIKNMADRHRPKSLHIVSSDRRSLLPESASTWLHVSWHKSAFLDFDSWQFIIVIREMMAAARPALGVSVSELLVPEISRCWRRCSCGETQGGAHSTTSRGEPLFGQQGHEHFVNVWKQYFMTHAAFDQRCRFLSITRQKLKWIPKMFRMLDSHPSVLFTGLEFSHLNRNPYRGSGLLDPEGFREVRETGHRQTRLCFVF